MKKILFGTIVALFCSAWLIGQGPSIDLLIQGGTVMDGSGSEPIAADIGIKGDRIEFIGDARASRISAARTLDASGLIVAPGFIDPHTHTLRGPQQRRWKSKPAIPDARRHDRRYRQ